MSLRQKLDARRVLNGAILLGAIALAWAIERPKTPAPPVMETYPAGWTVDPQADPASTNILRMRWPWWRAVLLETYDAMSKDRLLAVAAGVVFYALLAIFPATTALVSSYGLFAKASAIQDNLSILANVLPAGGIAIIQEQIARIAAQPSGLSIGFAAGLLLRRRPVGRSALMVAAISSIPSKLSRYGVPASTFAIASRRCGAIVSRSAMSGMSIVMSVIRLW